MTEKKFDSSIHGVQVLRVTFYQSVKIGQTESETVTRELAQFKSIQIVLFEDKIFLRDPTWKTLEGEEPRVIVVGLHNVRHFILKKTPFVKSKYADVFAHVVKPEDKVVAKAPPVNNTQLGDQPHRDTTKTGPNKDIGNQPGFHDKSMISEYRKKLDALKVPWDGRLKEKGLRALIDAHSPKK